MGSVGRVSVLVAVVGMVTGCGGGDDDDGAATIAVAAAEADGGLVDVRDVQCDRNGDQLLASGIVRNAGDNPHYVNISVRFIDGDGVRVELASDSVSQLESRESAHWDASVYASGADTVVSCEVAAEAS